MSQDIIRGHLNECFYEHPFKVDINNLFYLNTYPHPDDKIHKELKHNIAKYINVNPDNISITAGADESIKLIIDSISKFNNVIFKYSPSYVFIEKLNHTVYFVETPFTNRYKSMEFYRPKKDSIIYICNPCNPTNDLWVDSDIIELCTRYPECYIIVDEAYMDFYDMNRDYSCVEIYKNLFFVRTFSKLFGIADLRLGYFVHNKNFKVKEYCFKKVTNIAKTFANNIFKNLDFYKNIKIQIDNIKKNIGIISPTNFVFIHADENDLDAIKQYTEKNNILIRFGYGNAVRISFDMNTDVNIIKYIINKFAKTDIRYFYYPIDKRIKLVNLFRKFYHIAMIHDLFWWIDGGTLVGAHRHNAIIPWDNDIDIAILHNSIEKYSEILSQYFNIKKNISTDIYYQICDKEFEGHPRDSEHIDIFSYYEENGVYLNTDERFRYDTSHFNEKINFLYKKEELFPLKSVLFYDMYVPSPYIEIPEQFRTLKVYKDNKVVYKSSKLVLS